MSFYINIEIFYVSITQIIVILPTKHINKTTMDLKKRMFAVFVLVSLISPIVKAQYEITFEIKNTTTDTLLLGYYWHGGTYAIDTAINNNKGKFVFKNKTKQLEQGVFFVTDTKGHYCDFIITKEKNLKFKTEDAAWLKNLSVKGSKDEELYIDYMQKSDSLGSLYKEIIAGRETISKDEYDTKLKKFKDENDSLKNAFIKNHPDHLLAKILLAAKPIVVPQSETIYKQDGSVDSIKMQNNRFCYYKRHYFDNVDLTCDALLNTNKQVFIDNYNNYWENVMKYEKADSILYYAEYWINKTGNGKMFDFFVRDISSRYLQSPIMGHDKVYVGMVDKYLKTGKFTGLAPSDMEQNINRADKWRNLLLGQTVPDLACPEGEEGSKWRHLDEFKTKYKILVFWAASCGHCTTEIPKLFEFYKQYRGQYNLEVFAVHTEGEIKERDTFLDKYGINWVNVNGLIATYDWREYFDVEKTPIIYILDANNKILAKNIAADNVKQVMDILENGGFDL